MKRSFGPTSVWPRLVLPALAASTALSCNSYLFEQKCPEAVKESKIVVPAATPTPADILFVVNNSGSMADEQENLAANFEAFITEIAGAGDYHIMVVTTDVNTPNGERGGLQMSTYAPTGPKNLLDISVAGCSEVGIQHGCARGPDAAKRIIDSATMTKEEQIAAFQDNVRVGSCGSGAEKGLRGLVTALQKSRGDCNQGFLRDDANLVVILVSDENDSDDPPVPVEQYIADLGGIKEFSKVRFAAIIGSVDGNATTCRIENTPTCGSLCQSMPPAGSHAACTVGMAGQCPPDEFCQRLRQGSTQGQCENSQLTFWSTENCRWCSYFNTDDCCSALAGSRYVDFARGLEQRVTQADPSIPVSNCRGQPGTPIACFVDSICQANFAGTLARIARELVISNKYNLNPPAVYPPGVVVNVKGGRFGAGKALVYGTDFSITADGGQLTIMGDNTPREGENVENLFVTENKPTGQVGTGACANN